MSQTVSLPEGSWNNLSEELVLKSLFIEVLKPVDPEDLDIFR